MERGIYESVVYTAMLKMDGKFINPDFSSKEISKEDILWDKATLLFKTSNLKGIRNTIQVKLGEEAYDLKPKFDNSFMNTLESGFLTNLDEPKNQSLVFKSSLEVNGSHNLQFVPIGRETQVFMKSNWHSPSFNGNFLPDTEGKKISPDGFEAKWKVLETNRRFGQSFFDTLPDLSQFSLEPHSWFPWTITKKHRAPVNMAL